MPLNDIIAQQQNWAARRWPGHSSRRAPSLEDNLFGGLDDASRSEFCGGSGGELGTPSRPGKMASLRSSSALGYNVFAAWRGLDLSPFAETLNARIATQDLRFEQKFPHGLPSIPPNLDVVIDRDKPRPVAIECKFTETYGPKHEHPVLDAKYLPKASERWTDLELPRCQALAEALGNRELFVRLGVGQLLKHFLGIAHTTRRTPILRYVWFDTGCEEARAHRVELDRFIDCLGTEVDFRAVTYQDLFASLRARPEPRPGYHEYLESRYFPS